MGISRLNVLPTVFILRMALVLIIAVPFGCKKAEEPAPASAPALAPEPAPAPAEVPASERWIATTSKTKQMLPQFPWPPPRASAMTTIPASFFRQVVGRLVRLTDVDHKINAALDVSGYFERSYYAVPGGFALVTRLEQINPDGTPMEGDNRWQVEVGPIRSFSLEAYLRALFTSSPGYFRIVVFIVTPYPFSQADASVDRQDAIAWLSRGAHILPPEIGNLPYTERHSCTALIYEFEKIAGEQKARTLIPGRMLGRTHLEKSGLWDGLK